MSKLRFALLLFACCVMSIATFAETIPGDPRMGTSTCPGTTLVSTSTFVFTATIDSLGNGTSECFGNAFGSTITQIDVTPADGAYTTVPAIGNSCDPGQYFASCIAPRGDNGTWSFFGGLGIPPRVCDKELGCTGEFIFSMEGFNPGTWEFAMTLQTVPEPASAVLVATGLFGVVLRKRWRSRVA